MKIAFFTTITYPSRLANRVHVLSMCQAFTQNGHQVDLYARSITSTDDIRLKQVNVCTFSLRSAFCAAFWYVCKAKQHPATMWYVREPRLLFWMLLWSFLCIRKRSFIIYEVHDIPQGWLNRLTISVLKLCSRWHIVAITEGLKTDLKYLYTLSDDCVSVLPDGVDLHNFTDQLPKQTARQKIAFQTDKPLVVYTGSLYAWKGIHTLLAAADLTPELEYLIVGGKDKDRETLVSAYKTPKNVTYFDYKPHKEIPMYLAAADVLVLPNSGSFRISERYTSPLKLFEYMASNRPIVASNLPSIREIIVDKESACLFQADDAASLAEAIRCVVSDTELSRKLATKASDIVKMYTWKARASQITSLLTIIKNEKA